MMNHLSDQTGIISYSHSSSSRSFAMVRLSANDKIQ